MSTSDDGPLDAGPFSAWLRSTVVAIRGGGDADVPCDGCTACCTSSQFVHIAPDEQDVLARIPRELRFPAPGLPPGHVVLGYDEHGRCPMLVDGACSIYEHRPRTCRTYDCRVFPAAGVDPGPVQVAIADRASRWRFAEPTASDARAHAAVRSAAAFLRAQRDHLDPPVPEDATQVAVLAVELHELFLDGEPEVGAVSAALAALRSGDRAEVTPSRRRRA